MALAKEFGMAFFETSARTGHNVNETFYNISKLIKDKQQKNNSQNNNNNTNGNAHGQKQGNSDISGVQGATLKNNGIPKQKKKNECCK